MYKQPSQLERVLGKTEKKNSTSKEACPTELWLSAFPRNRHKEGTGPHVPEMDMILIDLTDSLRAF